MKVITEERLREIISQRSEDPHREREQDYYESGFEDAIEEAIESCQELDTLTVTSLRPMIDAPITDEGMKKVKTILAWNICEQMFIPIWVFADGGAMTEGESFNIKEFEGWIPMPKYEPEKV